MNVMFMDVMILLSADISDCLWFSK